MHKIFVEHEWTPNVLELNCQGCKNLMVSLWDKEIGGHQGFVLSRIFKHVLTIFVQPTCEVQV